MKALTLSDFPEQLAASAFVNGEEAAWEKKDCLTAIEWLLQTGNAILGIELWLIGEDGIRTAVCTKSGPVIYVSSCDPLKGETWTDYVQRSGREAAGLITAFRWPSDSLEPPMPVHFNLTWANLEWFRSHERECRKYF